MDVSATGGRGLVWSRSNWHENLRAIKHLLLVFDPTDQHDLVGRSLSALNAETLPLAKRRCLRTVSGRFVARHWATYLESFIKTTAKGTKDIRVLVESLFQDQRGVCGESAGLVILPVHPLSSGLRGKSFCA